ncbi:hypothetical protein Dimus_005832 [Dionaea muscipula]
MGDLTSSDLVERLSPTSDGGTVGIGAWRGRRAGGEIGDGEGTSQSKVMRRIFPSQYLGVPLLGNLKVSPYTGRLQFVDATNCIDAMVLDLPSTWNTADFYEKYFQLQ